MENLTFTFNHIGINCENREEAVKSAKLFEELFMQKADTEKKGSPFAGKELELIANGPGKHGHIAFYVSDMNSAIEYFENKGIAIDHSSAKRTEAGDIYVIYLKEEILGFAVQLFHK